jgi:hypothetical protein
MKMTKLTPKAPPAIPPKTVPTVSISLSPSEIALAKSLPTEAPIALVAVPTTKPAPISNISSNISISPPF